MILKFCISPTVSGGKDFSLFKSVSLICLLCVGQTELMKTSNIFKIVLLFLFAVVLLCYRKLRQLETGVLFLHINPHKLCALHNYQAKYVRSRLLLSVCFIWIISVFLHDTLRKYCCIKQTSYTKTCSGVRQEGAKI